MKDKFLPLALILVVALLGSCGQPTPEVITPEETGSVPVEEATDAQETAIVGTAPVPPEEPMESIPIFRDYNNWPVISPDNATFVKQVARLGKGTVFNSKIAWSPDGKYIAVSTLAGVYLYDPYQLVEIGYLPSENSVEQIAFSPDRKLLAFTDGEKIKLSDVTSGNVLLSIEGDGYQQYDRYDQIAFSFDRKMIIALPNNGSLYFWEVNNGQSVARFEELSGYGQSFSLSQDGRILTLGLSDGIVQQWDFLNQQEIRTWNAHSAGVTHLASTGDGRLIASGSNSDDNSKLWKIPESEGGPDTIFQFDGSVSDLAFSPDGRILAIWGSGYLQLLETESGTVVREIYGTHFFGGSERIAFSPDGNTLALLFPDGMIELWDASKGQLLNILGRHSKVQVYWDLSADKAISGDGRIIAWILGDDTIKLWDVARGKELSTIRGPEHFVEIALSPDGQLLATGSSFGPVILWDTSQGKEISTLVSLNESLGDIAWSMAFSPNGQNLAAGFIGGNVLLWDIATGNELYSLGDYTDSVNVMFSKDGRLLMTRTWDGPNILWNVTNGQEEYTFQGALKLALSPDGQFMASTDHHNSIEGDEKSVLLWDLEREQELPSLIGGDAKALDAEFSPDGRLLAVVSEDATVFLWEISSMQLQKTFFGNEVNSDDTLNTASVAFSPDGQLLAASDIKSGVRLLDVESGTEIQKLTGHSATVFRLMFSPDGRLLYSVSQDGTIGLWAVPSE